MTFLHQFFFLSVCVVCFFSLLLLVQDTQVGWQPIGEERVAVPAKDLVHTTWSAARRTIKSCLFAVLRHKSLAVFVGISAAAHRSGMLRRGAYAHGVCQCVCVRGCVRAARESGSHAGRLAWGGA